jgi:hypothetical protein
MPQCQFPIFYCFCVSEKLHRKYSQNWMKQKPNLLFLPKLRKDRRWDGGGPGASLTTRGTTQPLAVPTYGGTIGSTSWRCPSPIKSPQWEKPKGRIAFPQIILQAIAIVEQRSGGSRSYSRHPSGEGNPCQRPSPPPWSHPKWCVSSLPWTMGP